MTDQQLEGKFRMQAQKAAGSLALDTLAKDCWRLGELADVAQIARGLG